VHQRGGGWTRGALIAVVLYILSVVTYINNNENEEINQGRDE